MNRSIRTRLLILLLVPTIIMWLLASVKSYYDTQAETGLLFDAQLAQAARALLSLTSHELHEQIAFDSSNKEHEIKEQVIPLAHKYEQPVAYQIWTSQNRMVVRSANAPSDPMADQEMVFQDKIIDGTRWRVYAVWDQARTTMVQVGEDYSRRDAITNDVAMHIFTSLAITLPLLAILIWLAVGQAMKPMTRIADAVRKREFDNLQPISTRGVPEEILSLVKALNALFVRLSVSFDNIRRFTGDAAHELRTPLAALKTHAQVAQRATEPDSAREALDNLIEGANRASRTVEQMLTLARLDPESQVIRFEHVDICQIAEQQMADIATLSVDRSLDISLQCNTHKMIKGKSALIAILLHNLIGNAVRYTPDGGTIAVTIGEDQDQVVVSVADSGPGIEAQERDKVFGRFYRAPATATEQSGTGLGLSIVQRILELHGGKIELRDADLGGLMVCVWFSSAQPTREASGDIDRDDLSARA